MAEALDVDEASLIARSLAGDADAFGQLARLHQSRVRYYIGCYVRRPDVVDDLAQEVFLDAYRTLAGFRGASTFSNWLLGIARHRALRHLRADVRKSRRTDELLAAGRLADLEADDEHLVERERAMAALERCLDHLPAESAEIVAEHYFRLRSLADIARTLRKGEGAVRMSLLRIRRALRTCMERRLVEESSS